MSDNNLEKAKVLDTLISPMVDIYKQQQDYYKALIALNSTTLLITIAFFEKIFPSPKRTVFIIIPFALFAVSLLGSLYTMKLFGELSAHHIFFKQSLFGAAISNKIDNLETEVAPIRAKMKACTKKIERIEGPTSLFYFLGILALIAFALINLL